MSDLISRSTAMKNYCNALCPKLQKDEYCNNCIVKAWLNNQPTAYDIDKVVEKLKKQAEQYRHRAFEVEKKGLSELADKYYGKQCSYEHAIEIVKAGGNS